VNGASRDCDVDRVERHRRAETLGDADELDERLWFGQRVRR